MTQQQQSREFDVSDLSSIPWLGKYLTRFQVRGKGLFDMVAQEPRTQKAL